MMHHFISLHQNDCQNDEMMHHFIIAHQNDGQNGVMMHHFINITVLQNHTLAVD